MNNINFGKTMENVRKHIKLATKERRKNYSESEPNSILSRFSLKRFWQ